jgi:hypothetical protein
MSAANLTTKCGAAGDNPRVRIFCSRVWRPCNINADLLLISISGAKSTTGNNSKHTKNRRPPSRRVAQENAGKRDLPEDRLTTRERGRASSQAKGRPKPPGRILASRSPCPGLRPCRLKPRQISKPRGRAQINATAALRTRAKQPWHDVHRTSTGQAMLSPCLKH